jgi:hypothetical protein
MLDVERKELKAALEDLTIQYTKIDIERETIKEAIDALSEKYDISTRVLRKLALMFHKQNASEEFERNAELEELYEELKDA